MKIEFNKVTPLSKIIAAVLSVFLPVFGFILGVEYGYLYSSVNYSNKNIALENNLVRELDFKKIITETNPDIKESCSGSSDQLIEINSVKFEDLTDDGVNEAIVRASSCLSGTSGPDVNNVYKLSATGEPILLKVKTPSEIWDKFDGHFSYHIENNQLVGAFPIYKDGDSNCCPNGGLRSVYYHWDGNMFIFVRFEDVVPKK